MMKVLRRNDITAWHERFVEALSTVVGKRLTYSKLIGGEAEISDEGTEAR